ncbi:response regulator [Cohnella herbarum]|uniref:Circadian input-output histidine kinase CikA n=1 Tax=Cohnella herbarum TaxID=2728023 RepID=A0A7Z2VGG3_9BACL|nr:response regulator [Cohnella herbarum]QJD82652.1 response regulator [Cohnella herbarum]
MFRSLHLKIAIVLVLINVVSFALISLIQYETSIKQMNNQLIRHSLANLESTVANLDTLLDLRVKQAELLSESIPQLLETTELKLAFLRDKLNQTDFSMECIGIAGQDGTMSLVDGTVQQVASMDAYQQALKGIGSFSPMMLDPHGKPILWLMVPLHNSSNGIVGVVGLVLDPAQLFGEQLTLSSSDYTDSEVILIDRDTNLLYYRDTSLILKRNYMKDEPALRDFAVRLQNSEEGYGEASVFGRVLKMFYVKMPDNDWYAVFSVSKKEFEAPLRHAIWLNLGLTALTEIILGICLYFISRRYILNRLKQVVLVTKNVAAGNFYPEPLRIESLDEMGMLASSVNGMIDNLQDLFEPFQAFIRHNQYAMIVTDSQFVVTSFNKRAEEMLKYGENEIIGRKALLQWHDHDQLLARAKFYSDKLKRTITPDEAVLFVDSHKGFIPNWEWTWINRDGVRMLVSLNTSMMRYPNGKIKGYVLIARDISEIKKAVETNTRLSEILESAHDMIASFDMRGSIFYLNQAGYSFLGIESLNENNNRLSQYMPIPTTVRFADGLSEAQKLGYWQSEIEIIGANNRSQSASITVVSHQTDDGQDTFFSTIVRDISDQKEIERQLVKAKDEADEANEAKSSFLARMSHEIRTPLNGIIGLTYLLQRTELTELQTDYLRQVSESSQNLLRILNDILDFSKLEADKLILEQVPFRLEETLHRLSGIFSVLLGPKPVDFIIHLDPRIPEWIIGDPTRLEQVLLNLGANAIKFTNFGLIELMIILVRMDEGQATLHFSVKDTGIGMTDQQREQLFMPFVQADQKTSRKFGGTGLGLVISHTLVDLMGGRITIESAIHVGSELSFELVFPVNSQKSMPITLQPFELKVVVLEDHDRVAEHWRVLLSSFGCEVVTLCSWDQAMLLLKERKWDLFIVDMEAEIMHGEETWMNWKSLLDEHGVQVISSTSLLGRDALQQLPDEYKPAAVLVKPASSLHVRQALQVIRNRTMEIYDKERYAPSSLSDGSVESARSIDSYGTTRRPRIMVVDDQVINRLVANQILVAHGFDVELIESGADALAFLEAYPSRVDLILMDLHMPDMDGIEATTFIRRTFSAEDLPIVALTADMTKDRHVKCLNAGMNDIVTKPIKPEVLFTALGKWLPSLPHPSIERVTQLDETWEDTPYLKVSLALQQLNGKSALYLRLLDKFLLQYSDMENSLNALLNDKDSIGAIRLVHSLGGAAGHLGALAIQEAATKLESALLKGETPTLEKTDLLRSFNEGVASMQQLLFLKRS